MTIKELREKDALRLAERLNENPTTEQIEDARHTMRLYYTFTSLYQKDFYTEQDRNATQEDKEKATAKMERSYKRTQKAFDRYGLKIDCPGLYPTIDEKSGENFTRGYFYF